MCPALRYAAVVRLGRLAALAAAAVAGLAAAELVHRRAASGKPADHPDARTEAIIVLGYRSGRDGAPSPVQRWRCDIAVRSMDPSMSSTLIMSGWRGEAEVMAAYVHDVLRVPSDRIVLEKQARSTWENIAYSLPIAQDYDVIKIASDPLHVHRARRYVARLRPDLLPRLEPAAAYRPLEHPVLKAGTFGYELLRPLVRRARARADGRHARHGRRPKRP
jgi:uncharacterized SAM-binding protein YcdF (DUF218 family)